MDRSFDVQIADALHLEPKDVENVLNEFVLLLHRRLYEYKGLNGDYVGEQMRYDLAPQAFYHLLGFIECFSERYNWESGSASEYLARLGGASEWLPFHHQTEAWKSGRG